VVLEISSWTDVQTDILVTIQVLATAPVGKVITWFGIPVTVAILYNVYVALHHIVCITSN